MAQRQISIGNSCVVKLSQQEIVQLSKVKVNAIISELKSDDYISQKSPRDKYILTEKAIKALEEMQNEGK